MKLIIYLYSKYLMSFFISVSISFLIFYIFSLIGNLSEELTFNSVLYLSYLNSIQILTYIPSFIILLSLLLFVIFLRSRNEMLIIKEYLSTKVLIILFLPIVIIFSVFQNYKADTMNNINNLKENFLKTNKTFDTKIIITEKENSKIFTVLKNLDLNNSYIEELQRYYVTNGQITQGEFSNNLQIIDNEILAKEITQYKMNNIIKINEPNKILDNLDYFVTNQLVYHHGSHEIKSIKVLYTIGKLFYLILFFYCLILILFNKTIVDKKNNINKSLILCLLLLIYSLVINSLELDSFNTELSILSFSMIYLIFIKYFYNE